jgi:hypothetical protein
LAVLQQLFYERIARQQIANSNHVNLIKKFPLRGLIKGVGANRLSLVLLNLKECRYIEFHSSKLSNHLPLTFGYDQEKLFTSCQRSDRVPADNFYRKISDFVLLVSGK